ncbi:MAG: PQQ-dependent sugar dehydrogenase [Pseudomonadota bacterium]
MNQVKRDLFARSIARRAALGAGAGLLAFSLVGCGSDSPAPPPPPPPVTNVAPQVTSATAVDVPELVDASFYTATASDADGDAVTLSLSGGPDAGVFALDGAGALSFTAPPDFEIPGDADGNNIYEITLAASDGTATSSQTVRITVTDRTDVPMRTVRVGLGFTRPIFATGSGDGTNRLFVAEQGGIIRIIDVDNNDALPADPFLDITSLVTQTGNERGLLGLAFAPDYATSGLFYVHTTNNNGDTEILEFSVDPANPNRADPNSRRLILTFPQPFSNHNAGWLGFGTDGFLYIASGDGGGAGDPQGNAQNTNNLLGAILRIDPTADDFPGDDQANYAIPLTNPFINSAERDEIFAYGLRNPFRASVDFETGDLYIGDVGQGLIEEIDRIEAGSSGQNFGWNILEGTRAFSGGSTNGLRAPIAEYPHVDSPIGGFSVTGGYVHRGGVDALIGRYVFADFVSSNIWSLPVADIVDGITIPATDFTNITEDLNPPNNGMIVNISSFAEDDRRALYILDLFRGEVFRIENDLSR